MLIINLLNIFDISDFEILTKSECISFILKNYFITDEPVSHSYVSSNVLNIFYLKFWNTFNHSSGSPLLWFLWRAENSIYK